jgi:hypothetical protein
VAGAQPLTDAGAELSFRLPREAVEHFPRLLEMLDVAKGHGELTGYGISITTLEEVFLRISQDGDQPFEPNAQVRLFGLTCLLSADGLRLLIVFVPRSLELPYQRGSRRISATLHSRLALRKLLLSSQFLCFYLSFFPGYSALGCAHVKQSVAARADTWQWSGLLPAAIRLLLQALPLCSQRCEGTFPFLLPHSRTTTQLLLVELLLPLAILAGGLVLYHLMIVPLWQDFPPMPINSSLVPTCAQCVLPYAANYTPANASAACGQDLVRSLSCCFVS